MRMVVTRSGDPKATSAAVAATDSEYEVIYEIAPPGGWFGYWGPDVNSEQSVGVRFTSEKTYYLKKIALWFMNNGLPGVPEVTVTLRDDDNNGTRSIPGNRIFESWTFKVSAHGWNPVLEEMLSQRTPLLDPGTNDWIVCESDARPEEDGVWVMAAEGLGFSANTFDGRWQDGADGAVPGTVVRGIQPVE